MNEQHTEQYNTVATWIQEKENYLNTKETVHSVSEARTQLSLLDTYEDDKKSMR